MISKTPTKCSINCLGEKFTCFATKEWVEHIRRLGDCLV